MNKNKFLQKFLKLLQYNSFQNFILSNVKLNRTKETYTYNENQTNRKILILYQSFHKTLSTLKFRTKKKHPTNIKSILETIHIPRIAEQTETAV